MHTPTLPTLLSVAQPAHTWVETQLRAQRAGASGGLRTETCLVRLRALVGLAVQCGRPWKQRWWPWSVRAAEEPADSVMSELLEISETRQSQAAREICDD